MQAEGRAVAAATIPELVPDVAPSLPELPEHIRTTIGCFVHNFTELSPPHSKRATVFHRFADATSLEYQVWTRMEDTDGAFRAQLVEFLCWELHDQLMANPSAEKLDKVCFKICRKLIKHLTPAQLDIPPAVAGGQPWADAQEWLRRVPGQRRLSNKIACVMKCCSSIHQSFKVAGGADDFLPTLIFVVVHACVKWLGCQLEFMLDYGSRGQVNMTSYYLTSAQMAVQFVNKLQGCSLSMPDDEFAKLMVSPRTPGILHPTPQSLHPTPLQGMAPPLIDFPQRPRDIVLAYNEEWGTDGEDDECWWETWYTQPFVQGEGEGEGEGEEGEDAAVAVSGYLLKRGYWNTAWRRRWFVLRGHHLLYYTSRHSQEAGVRPLGSIPIRFCFVKVLSTEFHIGVPNGRVYMLKGSEDGDMQRWVSQLTPRTNLSRSPVWAVKQPHHPRGSAVFPQGREPRVEVGHAVLKIMGVRNRQRASFGEVRGAWRVQSNALTAKVWRASSMWDGFSMGMQFGW